MRGAGLEAYQTGQDSVAYAGNAGSAGKRRMRKAGNRGKTEHGTCRSKAEQTQACSSACALLLPDHILS